MIVDDAAAAAARYEAKDPIVAQMLAAIAEVVSGNLRARVNVPDDVDPDLKALGTGMNDLIGAWRASELRARKIKRSLEEQIATTETQALAIRELSTPVLQIWKGVLLLPVVGKLDQKRGSELATELLIQLNDLGSQQVIIDVTGVELVDERTADHLIRMVRSARLLGVRCVVTGVSARVAQTFVSMGADLGELRTLRSLEEGLVDCMKNAGR